MERRRVGRSWFRWMGLGTGFRGRSLFAVMYVLEISIQKVMEKGGMER